MKHLAKRIPKIGRLLQEHGNLQRDKGVLQLEKGNLEAEIRDLKHTIEQARAYLAQRYIKGSGIEIGPTYLPVKLPKKAKVKYVDEAPLKELLNRYPELQKLDMAPIHIVDNAEKLSKVKAKSLDFIIANHFMEHTLDPIGTVITHSKKLKKDGVLFYAIPDKRYTFDIARPVTTYDHLLKEHRSPSHEMKFEHFIEAAHILEMKQGDEIQRRAQELFDMKYSIHFHVWTRSDLIDFFQRTIKEFNVPLEITAVLENNPEAIFILRKIK